MDKLAKQYAEALIERVKEGLYLMSSQKTNELVNCAAVVKQPQYRKVVFEKGVTPSYGKPFCEAYWGEAQIQMLPC